jgi:hypothetical protein
MVRFAKRKDKSSFFSLELPSSSENSIFVSISRVYLLCFAFLGHETLVADVGEEKTFVDGDVGGVLVVGGVGGV